MAANRENAISDEIVDQLWRGGTGYGIRELLNGEMDHHLGVEAEEEAGNHRNGYSSKTVLSETGKLELSIPRDRHGRFDPVLIGKYRRRFAGFDDKIIALYARGMTTREIAEHVGELYGAEISPHLVSAVTEAVLEEVAAWQSRGLDSTYEIGSYSSTRSG
jgi:putative transposase